MLYTEKIRIYPNKLQKKKIDYILWECKNLYNKLLEYHNQTYKESKKSLSKFDYNNQIKHLVNLKEIEIHSQVLRTASTRLSDAFQRFFKKQNKYPKFKSIRQFKSFTYPQSTGFKLLPTNKIRLGKFGKVKAKFSRTISGTLKTCTIKKMNSGKYYAFIVIENENNIIIPSNRQDVIGIDLGIKNFITTNEGMFIKRPKFIGKYKNKLIRAQRKLSRKKIGSHNRNKCRLKLARIHEKISNTRRDHHFKVAHYLVNNYNTICCEKLSSNFMISKHKRKNKSITKYAIDISFYEFLTILNYMGNKYSSKIIEVDPFNTTQICSRCGSIVSKSLETRIHHCPECNTILDRDVNAAINIINRGLDTIRTVGTTGTITLVEIKITGLN